MATERTCKECKKTFTPTHHGGTKQFCSHNCANKHQWRTRKSKPVRMMVKACEQCKKEFLIPVRYSLKQWQSRKFCSPKCAVEANRINDGLTKGERYARKKGTTKQGTAAWLDRLRTRTKEGMNRPEVKEKLSKPRRPMTEANKMVRSNALVGKMPTNIMSGNNFPHIHRGEYECSKGTTYFRSKWEANYALYLDFLKQHGQIKEWNYENKTFYFEKIKLGTRSYTPDFEVLKYDDSVEYHEVKGYMDSRSKTKLKRMEKYHPDVTLLLIERAQYMDILKKLKGVVKFYN